MGSDEHAFAPKKGAAQYQFSLFRPAVRQILEGNGLEDEIPLRAMSDTRGQVTCLVGILREWRRNKPVFGYPFRARPLHLAAVINVGAKLQAVWE